MRVEAPYMWKKHVAHHTEDAINLKVDRPPSNLKVDPPPPPPVPYPCTFADRTCVLLSQARQDHFGSNPIFALLCLITTRRKCLPEPERCAIEYDQIKPDLQGQSLKHAPSAKPNSIQAETKKKGALHRIEVTQVKANSTF